ncbi:DGQHR domain-containing protein [Candidatus Woesearchaeota archaeon]|nr:DGQHR domain-containing protein [Candidatus Woesearchaeota archaeon]
MKLQAFEINQNGKKFYLTFMNGRELYDKNKIKVDIWRKEEQDGYQRKPIQSRITQFTKFIAKSKGASPLSILLSVRKKINFETVKDNYGFLKIPDNESLWEVDGQHRLEGLRLAIEAGYTFCYDFTFPVIIMCPANWVDGNESDSRYLEAFQFFIINRTQKGLKADLVTQFLARLYKKEKFSELVQLPTSIIKDIEWKPKAVEVSDILNKSDSVWRGKIMAPNDTKGETLISQLSFTNSLKPILLHHNFEAHDGHDLAEFLKRYWDVIKKIIPNAFKLPKEFVLQKTTGPFVLHRIFPDVASYCENRKLTEENFYKVLSKLEEGLNDDFWSSEGVAGTAGTNQKAFAILEKKLRDELESTQKEIKPIKTFKL